MPDSVGFYDNLTGSPTCATARALCGLKRAEADARIDAALERVRLAEAGPKPVRAYSRGMRQRLAIAEILMKGASVAILDEPTGGLDPQSTREFLELIRSLKHEGMTILLSSHLLELVQSVCDRVALFHRGRIGLEGRVDDLLRSVLGGSHVIRIEAQGDGLAEARSNALHGVTRVIDGAGRFRRRSERGRARRGRPRDCRSGRRLDPARRRPRQPRRSLPALFRGSARCGVKAMRSPGRAP